MSNYLTLPVSIGEGLDKLSILDIKLEFIQDKRRDNVKKEYDILYEKMKVYLFYPSIYQFYNSLKKTNLYIWKLMDELRDNKDLTDEKYLYLSKETIYSNDVRFRIKSKINNILNSFIKEEKGYLINRIIVDMLDYGDNIDSMVKPLYYFLINYDKVYIKTKNMNQIKCLTHLLDNQITIVEEYPDDLEFVKSYVLSNDINKADNKELLNLLELTEELLDKYI